MEHPADRSSRRHAAAAIAAVAAAATCVGAATAQEGDDIFIEGPDSISGAYPALADGARSETVDVDDDGLFDFSVFYYFGYNVAPSGQQSSFRVGASENATTRLIGDYRPLFGPDSTTYGIAPTRFDSPADAAAAAETFSAPENYEKFLGINWSDFATPGLLALAFEDVEGNDLLALVELDVTLFERDGEPTGSIESLVIGEVFTAMLEDIAGPLPPDMPDTPGIPDLPDAPDTPDTPLPGGGDGPDAGDPSVIPTPSAALLGSTLLGMLLARRRR